MSIVTCFDQIVCMTLHFQIFSLAFREHHTPFSGILLSHNLNHRQLKKFKKVYFISVTFRVITCQCQYLTNEKTSYDHRRFRQILLPTSSELTS
jgi:hypothetical protein